MKEGLTARGNEKVENPPSDTPAPKLLSASPPFMVSPRPFHTCSKQSPAPLRLQSPPALLLPPSCFLLRKSNFSSFLTQYRSSTSFWRGFYLASVRVLKAPPSISKTIASYLLRDGGRFLPPLT